MTLAALVLAAGRGERLRPLTDTVPKPLLEVGGTTLLDAALERVAAVAELTPENVAVNAHWLADQIVKHVAGRAHVSVEQPVALGTAGAVAQLRPWIAGRDLLVANGDVWYESPPDVPGFVRGWDGSRPRLLVVADEARPDFEDRWRFAGMSLLPWSVAETLDAVPGGLYERVWSSRSVELVSAELGFVDCGTHEDLREARRRAAHLNG